MLIPVGAFHGAIFLVSLGLCINLLFFDQLNLVFLLGLMIVGAILGGILGLFMNNNRPRQAWLIPLGSLLVAFIVFGLAAIFDYFFFGVNNMHWGFVSALTLLSMTPGTFVGWLIAEQLSNQQQTDLGRQRLHRLPTSVAGQVERIGPNPVLRKLETRTTQNQLLYRLEQEAIHLSPDCQNTNIQLLEGTNNDVCVTTHLATPSGLLKLYITCHPDYPHSPPDLFIEDVQSNQELVLDTLPILQHWQPGYKLNNITHAISAICLQHIQAQWESK